MPRYKIESTGNGTFITITRVADGATVFLQDDDALAFAERLDNTTATFADDDACDDYAHLFTVEKDGSLAERD